MRTHKGNILAVLVTATGFGLVIGFINRLQLVTNNYYTLPDLHNSPHYNLFSLFPLVFTIRFLATDLNTEIITVSQSSNAIRKSGLLITRQFFAGWPLVFFCAPSPHSLCYSRASAVTTLHSYLNYNCHCIHVSSSWTEHIWNRTELLPESRYITSAPTPHRKPSCVVG
jgi:hypothetical protein